MEKHKSCECNQFDNTLFVSTNRYNEKLEDSDFEEDHFDFDVDLRRSNSKGMAKLNTNWKKKLFIIICVRLGLNKVPEEQYSSIKEVLKFPQSVGIMGGKKNKALYFVGSEGDSLIFLDPHYVHDAVSKDYKNFSLETYSCDTPKKLSMGYLDPCLGFGFLIRDEDDFIDFKRRIGALKKSDQYFDYISVI
uniref:Cysteine protease n=1 Tax=Euplotes harpa TaxID=151035 RepID=A0A7S3JJD3_9SPIT|mmetsp:Transcript_43451/g.51131  ORF Transcript_43451/g.51131 Transcript_43451/m.51131 type:complete len:191 (+) Transcript_43451:1396-1968(+)